MTKKIRKASRKKRRWIELKGMSISGTAPHKKKNGIQWYCIEKEKENEIIGKIYRQALIEELEPEIKIRHCFKNQ